MYCKRTCCIAWRNTIVSTTTILRRTRSLKSPVITGPSTNATFAVRFTSTGRCWSSTKLGLTVIRRTTRGADTFAHYAARSWRLRRASKSTTGRIPAKSRTPAQCAASVSPVRLCWGLTMSLTPENGNIRATNAAKPLHRGPPWLFISDITRANDRTFVLDAVRVSSHELSLILIWSPVVEVDLSSWDWSSQREGI